MAGIVAAGNGVKASALRRKRAYRASFRHCPERLGELLKSCQALLLLPQTLQDESEGLC